MQWITRLEQKYRRFRIPNLTLILLVGMVAVFILHILWFTLSLFGGDVYGPIYYFYLSRDEVLSGQIWRLITFLFIPRTLGVNLWTVVNFYFVYYIGREVESRWSGFRFTLYALLGWLCAVIAVLVGGEGTNYFLLLSFFLAFATLASDTQITLFYIIPIKAKWLGLLYVGFALYEVYTYFAIMPSLGLSFLITLLFSLVPYFLFFGPTLWQGLQEIIRVQKWRQKNR